MYTVPFAETAATFTVSILAGGPTITAQPTGGPSTTAPRRRSASRPPVRLRSRTNGKTTVAAALPISAGRRDSSYSPTCDYAAQGRQYRCVVTDANGSATSAAATLRVAFNLSGTGPRSVPLLGHPLGLARSRSYIRGTADGGAPSCHIWCSCGSVGNYCRNRRPSDASPDKRALASQSATIAGSATHLLLHTTTGALSAPGQRRSVEQRSTSMRQPGLYRLRLQRLRVLRLHLTPAHDDWCSIVAVGDHRRICGAPTRRNGCATSPGGDDFQLADHRSGGDPQHLRALNANAATIAGSATHLTLHTTTGALRCSVGDDLRRCAAPAHHERRATGSVGNAGGGCCSRHAAHDETERFCSGCDHLGGCGSMITQALARWLHSRRRSPVRQRMLRPESTSPRVRFQAGDASISGLAAAPVQRQILGGWAKFAAKIVEDQRRGRHQDPQPMLRRSSKRSRQSSASGPHPHRRHRRSLGRAATGRRRCARTAGGHGASAGSSNSCCSNHRRRNA